MAKMPSMSRVFERRGDPLVSEKEGLSGYGRLPSIEDAERDAEAQKLTSKFWDRKLTEELRKANTVVAEPEDKVDSPEVIAQRRARNVLRQYNMKRKRF